MTNHPYLRAFLAGAFVPTLILPLMLTGFIVLRMVLQVPFPFERAPTVDVVSQSALPRTPPSASGRASSESMTSGTSFLADPPARARSPESAESVASPRRSSSTTRSRMPAPSARTNPISR